MMKKKVLKTVAILLLAAGGFSSCGKDNNSVGAKEAIEAKGKDEGGNVPYSENPVIIDTVNSIEFIFSLLNKDGEPSTTFNEGENFSFYFKCTNLNVNNELRYTNSFLSDLLYDGFCRIISQQNDTIGYPCTSGFGTDNMVYYPFYGENNSYEIIISWNDSRERWIALSKYYENLRRDNLLKGKYYTGFTHVFRFSPEPEKYTAIPVSFKINFEIK
ncbi:MAG: hypothetical protein LBS43_03340 [Prevotellaceae bacterium]|jgi:hypothetical protein|nr:hypothetical protein [Prevotellaceae bacterium]